MEKVSAWLGHKDPDFTFKRYYHYIPQKVENKEAERINKLLFGSSGKKKTAGS
ncbi:MAG: hypothetical protein WA118_10755 [Carboxydocellales bacterium]